MGTALFSFMDEICTHNTNQCQWVIMWL